MCEKNKSFEGLRLALEVVGVLAFFALIALVALSGANAREVVAVVICCLLTALGCVVHFGRAQPEYPGCAIGCILLEVPEPPGEVDPMWELRVHLSHRPGGRAFDYYLVQGIQRIPVREVLGDTFAGSHCCKADVLTALREKGWSVQ